MVMIHFKSVIIDYSSLYIGSANFTGAGMGAKSDKNRNFEIGIWTKDEALLDYTSILFDKIWQGDKCTDCGRKNVCPVPLEEFHL